MQHSLAASINNKQTIYAAHNDMGKADLFVTLTPRDDLQYDILVYALLPEESILHKNVSPTKNFRFDLLAEKPVVAGLVFERVDNMFIKIVLGWDTGRSFKCGGLFGIVKGFLRVLEEQSRSTLHGHYLIWLAGHGDIKLQLVNAIGGIPEPMPSTSHGIDPILPTKIDSEKKTSRRSNGTLQKNSLQKNIENLIQGELLLPETEMKMALKCPKVCCRENFSSEKTNIDTKCAKSIKKK